MDSDLDDGSVFSMGGDDSDVFIPEPKAKAKAAPKKAAAKTAPKKMIQTTLNKKRKSADDDLEDDTISGLSNTPPSAKKQKKAPAKKATAKKPLEAIENDSLLLDDDIAPMAAAAGPKGSKKTATETYQKLTQLEHIIKRPDTYIGSVELTEQKMWVFNKETSLMELRTINFVPGLYKIFDEILVNAADNKQRDTSDHVMTYLKVTIDRSTGEISVENNGHGIPIEIHEKEKIYVPELIFGHLLTGSNYDDDEKKTVGGRNGYGAKLCNVFSTQFHIEVQDSINGKRYKQTWNDNMTKVNKAKITSSKSSNNFVKISFTPDYKRFGMPDGIDDSLESLAIRRVYDLAGTVNGVKVYLNGNQLKLKDFKAYCELYAKAIGAERAVEEGGEVNTSVAMDVDRSHPRWQIGFTVSDGSFQQISFVNSIATTTGGNHVNYIADQITSYLLTHLNKRKKGHTLKQNHIRNHIFVFVNCLIDNPAFTSQTKEQMTTKVSQFGSKCVLSEEFLKKVAKSDAITKIIDFADRKADQMMAKSDGSKRSRVSNAKLVDANLAGSRRGHECTLILTEGDSAKSLAVAGRAILDPDRIGVFPLRGKLLNVRDASVDQVIKNQEIQNIKQFLGLKHKTTYTDTKTLRYGHLMIMADQDHDGSHIKGLLINFLQVQYPSLLKIPDFFREFITPIVKVWQGSNPKKPQKLKSFFTQPQYEAWKEAHEGELSKWNSKYFKGLGTSSNEDAQVYFNNLDDHLKEFDMMKPEEADLFDLAFSKKKADSRKEWLGNFVPGTFLDHSTKSISYADFVNKELILFSMADNIRSIPSVLDGLKPGQRKVIYACLKRNLVKDTKVIELAGYVSEKTSYHHGEASLQQTIIGLAQDFVGSNNVNCLEPSGNFGSRLGGGSDAASPRYIHTRLSPFARKVFISMDDPNLEDQFEDGKKIEPKTYAPIVPLVLINGADGIGTGWSTSIPNYHPIDVVKNIKRRMGRLDPNDDTEQPFETMMPWWRGWKGTPEPAGPDRYKFNGIAYQSETKSNEIIITELPIRTWTDDFKSRLEEIISGSKGPSWIKDYKEFNDHKRVHFEIMVDEKSIKSVMEDGLAERFKLNKQIATSNMVAFDPRGRIRRYEKVEEILEEFYHYRYAMYTERKSHWLGVYSLEFKKLNNQARFIQEIIDGKLVVSRKKKDVLIKELRDRKYDPFPRAKDPKGKKGKQTEEEINESGGEGEEGEAEEQDAGTRDYDYLLSMPIWSLTLERLNKLKELIAKKKAEYDTLDALSEKDLWCADLDAFVDEWEAQQALDSEIQTNLKRMGRRVSKKLGAGGGKGSRSKAAAEDDDYEPGQAKGRGRPKGPSPKKAPKTHQRFAEMFSSNSQSQNKDDEEAAKSEGFSDDDFAALGRSKTTKAASKAAPKAKTSTTTTVVPVKYESVEPDEEEVVAPVRSKRAAAAKPKKWVLDDDSDSDMDDDDKLLGDVGAMVKGISNNSDEGGRSGGGRLSLFSMSRPESRGGGSSSGGQAAALPKARSKTSRTLDLDSNDDTNYEMLAKSSPHKAVKANDFDALLSDDDDDDFPAPKPSTATTSKLTSLAGGTASAAPAKKQRSRAAPAKSKAKDAAPVPKAKAPSSKAKATTLSPAAKAYAARKASQKSGLSDSEPEDVEVDSPPPRPAARGRPARAAAASKPKPTYIDSDSLDLDLDDDDNEDGYDLVESD